MNKVREWIVEWFVSNTTASKEKVMDSMNENYLNIGFIDSFEFINLIADIEENFDVEFDNDQFLHRDFSTMNGLSKVVEGMIENE